MLSNQRNIQNLDVRRRPITECICADTKANHFIGKCLLSMVSFLTLLINSGVVRVRFYRLYCFVTKSALEYLEI